MSEYQAIYDAVRSKIHMPDLDRLFREALDISHPMQMIQQEFMIAAGEMQRPSVVFKPKLFPDGNMWCALFGDDLQNGVAGFGETPSLAMYDFDKNWRERRLPAPKADCEVCGEEHNGKTPLSCATGDGV